MRKIDRPIKVNIEDLEPETTIYLETESGSEYCLTICDMSSGKIQGKHIFIVGQGNDVCTYVLIHRLEAGKLIKAVTSPDISNNIGANQDVKTLATERVTAITLTYDE